MWFGKSEENRETEQNIYFDEVNWIVMEYESLHIEISPFWGKLTYRRIASLEEMGLLLPEGYYDTGRYDFTLNSIMRVARLFNCVFQKREFTSKPDLKPSTTSYEVYLRIHIGGKILYDRNRGIRENCIPGAEKQLAEEYINLIRELKGYCMVPKPIMYPVIRIASEEDEDAGKTGDTSEYHKLIGYHSYATGVYSYGFYRGEEELCSASGVVIPSPPIGIYGYGHEWESEFDEYSTIFPGLTRYVKDRETGQVMYKIVYREQGIYEINDSIMVYCTIGRYAFVCDYELIAQIRHITEEPDFIPQSDYLDVDPYFEVFITPEMDEQLLMIICSFPILQFAL